MQKLTILPIIVYSNIYSIYVYVRYVCVVIVIRQIIIAYTIYNRLKISYSCDCSVKAVLVSDKTAKAEPYSKPQQYIEVPY